MQVDFEIHIHIAEKLMKTRKESGHRVIGRSKSRGIQACSFTPIIAHLSAAMVLLES